MNWICEKLRFVVFILIGSITASLISVSLFFGAITSVIPIYFLVIFWVILVVILFIVLVLSFQARFSESVTKQNTADKSDGNPSKHCPFYRCFKILRQLSCFSKSNPVKGIPNQINSIVDNPNKAHNFSNRLSLHAVDSSTGEKDESTTSKQNLSISYPYHKNMLRWIFP